MENSARTSVTPREAGHQDGPSRAVGAGTAPACRSGLCPLNLRRPPASQTYFILRGRYSFRLLAPL
jgi:hypothetical protein